MACCCANPPARDFASLRLARVLCHRHMSLLRHDGRYDLLTFLVSRFRPEHRFCLRRCQTCLWCHNDWWRSLWIDQYRRGYNEYVGWIWIWQYPGNFRLWRRNLWRHLWVKASVWCSCGDHLRHYRRPVWHGWDGYRCRWIWHGSKHGRHSVWWRQSSHARNGYRALCGDAREGRQQLDDGEPLPDDQLHARIQKLFARGKFVNFVSSSAATRSR